MKSVDSSRFSGLLQVIQGYMNGHLLFSEILMDKAGQEMNNFE